jgi:hypothetical protein
MFFSQDVHMAALSLNFSFIIHHFLKLKPSLNVHKPRTHYAMFTNHALIKQYSQTTYSLCNIHKPRTYYTIFTNHALITQYSQATHSLHNIHKPRTHYTLEYLTLRLKIEPTSCWEWRLWSSAICLFITGPSQHSIRKTLLSRQLFWNTDISITNDASSSQFDTK